MKKVLIFTFLSMVFGQSVLAKINIVSVHKMPKLSYEIMQGESYLSYYGDNQNKISKEELEQARRLQKWLDANPEQARQIQQELNNSADQAQALKLWLLSHPEQAGQIRRILIDE